ncbi:pseudouridine synthase [Novosphingobium olei]|uniref:pseudouridine synthase n=1 Tax=Novosphingobium olei TaxID=2728851 RepID=UPI00308A134C|nr:pseudouridine synthase [Novosphingobium olei]
MSPSEKDAAPREGERIAKLLARAGIASRREVERLIEAGRVELNGVAVTTPATVLTSLAGITVDGKPVGAVAATRIFMFHKPSGLITAERDPAGRPTIYTALRNALPEGAGRVMPVGRLDLNTEGLLLLTNDGELKRALELPASGIPRTYRARTFGDINQEQLEELSQGLEIDGIRYGSIDANMERRTGRNQWVELTLTEGKNREVRRVLEHLGLQVSRLLRTSYGPFHLGALQRGSVEEVPPAIVERFMKAMKLDKPVIGRGAAPRPRPVAAAAPAPARPEQAPRTKAFPKKKPVRQREVREELDTRKPGKPNQRTGWGAKTAERRAAQTKTGQADKRRSAPTSDRPSSERPISERSTSERPARPARPGTRPPTGKPPRGPRRPG